MSEWVTVIPDEFYICMKRTLTLADVDTQLRAAHKTAAKVNKLIPNPDELTIICNFWSDEQHWIVKASVFGSDHQHAVFHMMWAWS